MNKKKKKTFDAVKLMRSMRDKLGKEIENMSYQEEIKWLSERELKDPFLNALMQKAMEQRNGRKRVLQKSM